MLAVDKTLFSRAYPPESSVQGVLRGMLDMFYVSLTFGLEDFLEVQCFPYRSLLILPSIAIG